MSASRVLIVEDDRSAAEYLRLLLVEAGHEPRVVPNGVEGLLAIEEEPFDLVISDLRMPQMDGLELLSRVGPRWPDLPVVVVTAEADVSEVVSAVKLGAIDYLVKPAPAAAVLAAVDKALAAAGASPRQLDRAGSELVGRSRGIVEVRQRIALAARNNVPLLITGETGTGKELVARAIHRLSNLRDGPFVAHNCSLAPRDLFESEFFGHRRGSFTGAERDHRGLLQQAHGGVLLLDELETMPLEHQAKLLRVLDDGEVRPVGSEEAQRVSIRFLAATNRQSLEMIAEGSLREDLYYRLRGIEIHLPPLRERREDIPLLAAHFLRELDTDDDASEGFMPETVEALASAFWPGNVRELRNTVRSARAAAGRGRIGLRHLPPGLVEPSSLAPSASPAGDELVIPGGMTLRDIERRAILQALRDCDDNRTQAAKLLGINRSTLRRKLQEFGID